MWGLFINYLWLDSCAGQPIVQRVTYCLMTLIGFSQFFCPQLVFRYVAYLLFYSTATYNRNCGFYNYYMCHILSVSGVKLPQFYLFHTLNFRFTEYIPFGMTVSRVSKLILFIVNEAAYCDRRLILSIYPSTKYFILMVHNHKLFCHCASLENLNTFWASPRSPITFCIQIFIDFIRMTVSIIGQRVN